VPGAVRSRRCGSQAACAGKDSAHR
jgi:hypothetical protein